MLASPGPRDSWNACLPSRSGVSPAAARSISESGPEPHPMTARHPSTACGGVVGRPILPSGSWSNQELFTLLTNIPLDAHTLTVNALIGGFASAHPGRPVFGGRLLRRVVGDVQDVVRLVVREVHLEQTEPIVDRPIKLQPLRHCGGFRVFGRSARKAHVPARVAKVSPSSQLWRWLAVPRSDEPLHRHSVDRF